MRADRPPQVGRITARPLTIAKGDYQTRYDSTKDLYTKKDKDGNAILDADGNVVYLTEDGKVDGIEEEVIADLVGDYLFTDEKFVENLLATNEKVFKGVWNEIKYFVKISTAGSEQQEKFLEAQRAFERAYNARGKASGGTQYSLSQNARSELKKVLQDTNYRNEVLLRDETPAIMLSQKGVRNLPMAMNASHIRENVFTEEEAKNLGLRVDDNTHYHGLGEDFFLKVIDGLDNVKEAYRGTKNAKNPMRGENYFLLVSEFTDDNGNTVNVPVYIDEHAQFNRVFVDVNKISTVFGRDNFRDYIARQVQNKDLVRIKNRSTQTSERDTLIVPGYGEDASNDTSLPQNGNGVKGQFSLAEAPVKQEISSAGTSLNQIPAKADKIPPLEKVVSLR